MAGKTNTDKIDELVELIAHLRARTDASEQLLREIRIQIEVGRTRTEELNTRVVVVERESTELKKQNEEWGRRSWQLLVPLVTAVLGAFLGYYLKR